MTFHFRRKKFCVLPEKKNRHIIVLVSPNSPTGQSIPVDDVEKILAGTSSLVLVDEAYIEFSEKQSVQSLLEKYERLIILRTFSKAFSMAGLRIGYLLAGPALCAELLKPKSRLPLMCFRPRLYRLLDDRAGIAGVTTSDVAQPPLDRLMSPMGYESRQLAVSTSFSSASKTP